MKGKILVITAAIISGFSIFINQLGVKDINPFIFTFSKNILVGLFVLVIILASFNAKNLYQEFKGNKLKLLLISFIGGCVPFLLFFKGLTMTSAASGGFIQKTLFLFTCILAAKFLKEKLNFKYYLIALGILVGNAVALNFIPPFSFNWGDLMILAATIMWAVENTISKSVLEKISTNTLIFFRMFLGAVLMLPILFLSGDLKNITTLTQVQKNWIVVTAFILLGYVLFWYNGLQKTKLSTASIILVLGSPITTVLNLMFLAKVPTQTILIGNIILFASVALVFIDKKKLLWMIKRN